MSDAFSDVAVFDGERVIGRFSVFVAGELISELIPSRAGLPERDYNGMLLPGFIDAHAHVELVDAAAVLRSGVTTVRDLGWPLKRIEAFARDTFHAPAAGPAVVFAGPMLTAIGGYPRHAGWAPEGTAFEIDSEDEARAAVYTLAEEHGVHTIKVAQEPRSGPVLPFDVLKAACDAAHAQGRRVASHCGSLEELEKTVDAGVDELAHGLWSDEAVPAATVQRMVRAGMTVIPTLHIDPSSVRIDNLRRFVAAGGNVVYGTDMGNPPAAHGIDVEELRLMSTAGMSNESILRAATAGAADLLALEDRGRIAEGMRADLMLVEGNPLDDLTVLAKPVAVMRGGVAL